MPATFLPPPPPWLAQTLSNMQPPDWLLHELELKGVLAINHVLLAQPDVLPRTRRLSGQSVQLRWQKWAFQWTFTPVGLLERVDVRPSADLVLNLGDIPPWEVVTRWYLSITEAIAG